MKNHKVTNEQREEILRRSRQGDLQKHIAAAMKVSPDTVRAIEAQAGLRRHPGHVWTPEEEKAAIAMLINGHGQPYIERALSLSAGTAREIVVAFRQRQARGATGHRYNFSKLELRAISRDLRQARVAIAKKWRTTLPWMRQFDANRNKNYRQAAVTLPKAEDVLHLMRMWFPSGLPFSAAHDAAAANGMIDGIKVFLPLTESHANGLRARFGEALSTLRKEESGIWIH